MKKNHAKKKKRRKKLTGPGIIPKKARVCSSDKKRKHEEIPPFSCQTRFINLWLLYLIPCAGLLSIPLGVISGRVNAEEIIELLTPSTISIQIIVIITLWYLLTGRKKIRIDGDHLYIERGIRKPHNIPVREILHVESLWVFRQPYTAFKINFKDPSRKKISFSDLGLTPSESTTLQERLFAVTKERVVTYLSYEEEMLKEIDKCDELQSKRMKKLEKIVKWIHKESGMK